jgi:hypothetical protein
MKFPLVSNKQVRESDSGNVDIPERNLTHSEIPDVDKRLTQEYARMVQDNPEYAFTILRDSAKGVVRITWMRRE